MSYEERLVELLETAGTVYRIRLPINAELPAQTYQRISSPHAYDHSGDVGLVTARVQVDCWALDPDVADELANAGPLALSGRADDFFSLIEVADDRELDEPDTGIFRRSVDLMLTYPEEAAGS